MAKARVWKEYDRPTPLTAERRRLWFDREPLTKDQFTAVLFDHDPDSRCYTRHPAWYRDARWRNEFLTPEQALAAELLATLELRGRAPREWFLLILLKPTLQLALRANPEIVEEMRRVLVDTRGIPRSDPAETPNAPTEIPKAAIDDAVIVLRTELASFPEVQQLAGEALLRWAWACRLHVIERPDWSAIVLEFERLGGSTDRDAAGNKTFKWAGGETSNKRLRETILERVNRVLERCPPP